MTLSRLLLAAFAALAFAPATLAQPKAVVELFTSQGCSSCRAADAYFEELAERDEIVALSFHVDYWDYLGWRDTFGDPEHTARQKRYSEVLGSRRIYTPQMIVNGTADLVGSDREAVEAALGRAALPVPVSMERGNGTLTIKVAARPPPRLGKSTIRLVLFSSEATVQIARGENAGTTVEYYNIVRAMRPIGMWDGEAVEISLPVDELMGDGVDGCAVIVQEERRGGPGPILGAAAIDGW